MMAESLLRVTGQQPELECGASGIKAFLFRQAFPPLPGNNRAGQYQPERVTCTPTVAALRLEASNGPQITTCEANNNISNLPGEGGNAQRPSTLTMLIWRLLVSMGKLKSLHSVVLQMNIIRLSSIPFVCPVPFSFATCKRKFLLFLFH